MNPRFPTYHAERPSADPGTIPCYPERSDGFVRRGGRFCLALAGMVLFALLALTASAVAPAAAAAVETDLTTARIATAADSDVTWTYTLDLSGDAVITGYTLKNGVTEIGIPETIDGHRVGAVANEVFSGDTRLVRVAFPSSVVRLGEHLFENCTNLTYVDLTAIEELDEIPVYCFRGCTALTSVDIPANVTRINGGAFQGCTSLKQLNIPPSGKLDDISIYAFQNCESLQSLDLPAQLKTIGQFSFDNCKSMVSIRFRGSSINIIDECAFRGCSALEELYLPDNVNEIRKQAFENCTSLKVVVYGTTFPQVLQSDLFKGCDAIELMMFHTQGAGFDPSEADMKKAGWKKDMAYMTYYIVATSDNAAISHIVPSSKHSAVTVPAKIGYRPIVRIASSAAQNKTLLTEVRFPSDSQVSQIGSDTFRGCTALHSIEIPATVKEIGPQAFMGCTSLSSVSFKTTSLGTIEYEMFNGCTSLEEITIPEGVHSIEERAFFNCLELKTVNLPDSLQNLGPNAFDCGKGKQMAIGIMRMPNSPGVLNTPSDRDFFQSWMTTPELDTFCFKVTYGSTADAFWFDSHLTYADPVQYPIPLKECNRVYEPVAIGDEETHLEEANDVKLTWNHEENWTGEQIIPKVTATRWNRSDAVGTEEGFLEVALEDGDGKSVGVHHLRVTGKEPYFTGYRIIEYKIVASNMDDVEMGPITPPCVWDNGKWEPDPEFYVDRSKYSFLQDAPDNGNGAYTLVKGEDYTIKGYEHNKMGSTTYPPTITIDGKGNFEGNKSFEFAIEPANLANTQVKVADQVYTGEAVKPVPSEVMLLDRRGGDHYTVELNLNTDYVVDPNGYTNNTDVGIATMTLIPVDGCTWLTGSKEVSFNIVQADLSKATVKAVPDQTYTGKGIEPALEVSSGEGELVQGRDYTVSWKNNINVGTAQATLSGNSVGCTGEKTITFKIVPKPVTVTPYDAGKTYGGADPELEATVEGTVGSDTVSYSLSRAEGEDVGMYAITATGAATQGNYAVTFKTGTFTIGPASIADATVARIDAVTYDGAAHEPEPAVTWGGRTLVKDKDYLLAYANNVNAGQEATVIVQGVGNFKDEVRPRFTILQYDLRRDGCEVFVGFQVRTGNPLEPHPARVTAPGRDGVLVLKEGVDYEVDDDAWRNNVNVGTGYVNVRGIGNFCESREGSFNIINNGDLSQGSIRDISDQTYTGGPIEPPLHVELTGVDMILRRDVDYKADFTDNVNVGGAHVKVTGLGAGVSGSLEAAFSIKPAGIAEATVTVADQVFSGGPLKPSPVVTWNEMLLIKGKDYEVVSYVDNLHVGTATLTVRGKGNFEGTASGTFEIKSADISSAAVAAEDRVYSGTAQTPVPTVSWNEMLLIEGKDYEVTSYANNVHAGTATVTVTGKGDFSGTASGTYQIARKPATIKVNSASKVQGEADPAFTGTVDGLVGAGDLGEIKYVRTNDDESPGTYEGVLDAKFAANADYDVSVAKGDFTIKEALTAIWLDGDGSVLQTKTYGKGDPTPAYDGKEPTKAATEQYTYSFTGWDGGTVEGATTTYRPLFRETLVPAKKGTLTFDLGGGTIDGKTSLTIEADVGDVITIPKAPVREGYTFKYWKGSEYYPGDKYTVEGDHAFTAVWEKKSGGGSGGGSGGASAKGSSPTTGDPFGGAVAGLAIVAVAALCLTLIAVRLRRREESNL